LKETSKFKEWFKGSKILDDQGSPKVVYHGTDASFEEFNRAINFEGEKKFGFHFGSAKIANERLRDKARYNRDAEFLKGSNIIPAYLNIKKPLRLPDISNWEHSYLVARQLEKHYPKKFKGILDKLAGIEEKGYRLDWDEYKLNAEQIDYLRDAIKAEGYDGIVYSNQYEGILHKDRPRFGRPKGELSIAGNDAYIAFEPDQIKMKLAPLGAKGLLKEAQKHNNPKDFVEQMYIETSPSMWPGETLLSKEATKETGLYHGTNPGAIQGILNTGKIQARISRLDKAGQKSVSVSGNKGVAGSYGNVIFELDPKLKVVEPPAGVVRGDYYKGFEFRHSEDIPISKIKSAFIDIGSKENLNTRIFIGWEGNQAIYKTIGEVQSQLESKGINTYVANFGNKSALSDIWQQAQAIK
jgi:hypothetical protein